MKKTTISIFYSVILSFMISGCASKWVHPIKTDSDFITDNQLCIQKATTLYPPLYYSSPFQAGSLYPTLTHNSPIIYVHGKRGLFFPPTYSWQDYNEQKRKREHRDCLYSLGWE